MVLGVGAAQLFYPIFSTTLPKYLSANGKTRLLKILNKKVFFIIFFSLIIFWIFWFLLGEIFISIYLGNALNNNEMFLYISIFLFGSSLYSIGGTLQNNLLSFNLVKIILHTNIVCLIVISVGQPLLISLFSITGACFGWATINFTITFIYGLSFLINRRRIL